MKHFARFPTLLFPIICGVICLGNATLAAGKGKEWMTLENCELVPNRANDGDSFHIRANNVEYLVRLYFVDAPETGGVGSPERLIEQAGYFGVSVPQAIEIGQNAKAFVQTKLAEPFKVVTRMAEGLGHSNIPRILGFVKTKDGSDLGELLVANGLARVHGTKTAPPGLSRAEDETQNLERLEQEAKQKKLGGWGRRQCRKDGRVAGTRTHTGSTGWSDTSHSVSEIFHAAALGRAVFARGNSRNACFFTSRIN